MRTEQQYAALNAIAKECNKQLKMLSKGDLLAMADVTVKFAEKAKIIGFSKTELLHRIGVINGQLTDRRLEGF